MPALDSSRRRTPSSGARRAGVLVLVALASVAAACGSGADEPRSLAETTTSRSSPTSATGDHDSSSQGTAGPAGTIPPTASGAGLASLREAAPLVAAAAIVPQRAAVVSFTDLDAVKQRLGYSGLTSDSPTSERFAFWERARADGAMFAGTRLYDASSVMALDYGWTGEDVRWEVDYALTEKGCLRSMLCTTAHGYVLGLRPDLDWSVVTGSLRRNGFEQTGNDPGTFHSDDPSAPFEFVHLIPELHAIAGGNPIGIQRLAEVAAGAPPFGVRVAPFYDRLGQVESLHVATGCVTLAAALGPDATEDDAATFLRGVHLDELAAPVSTTVAVSDPRHATVVVEFASAATPADLAGRVDAVRRWPGLQLGEPFADVADVDGRLDGSYEIFRFDVRAISALRTMVLTDDAPWALCPPAEGR